MVLSELASEFGIELPDGVGKGLTKASKILKQLDI